MFELLGQHAGQDGIEPNHPFAHHVRVVSSRNIARQLVLRTGAYQTHTEYIYGGGGDVQTQQSLHGAIITRFARFTHGVYRATFRESRVRHS